MSTVIYQDKGNQSSLTLVFQNEKGVDVTTSLLVAKKFGKRNSDVLRDVRNLSCSDEFRERNFALCQEVKQLQVGSAKFEYYTITKDGFSFLVMGYTGEKAGKFKEEFIREFNKREMMLKNEDYILMRSMQILQDRVKTIEMGNEILLSKNNLLIQEIKESAPKVVYYNEVLNSQCTYPITLIAKELGFSGESLNRMLSERGVQYKQSGVWLLAHRYQTKGYTKTRTHTFTKSDGTQGTSMLTVWTEKGREFIHRLFNN